MRQNSLAPLQLLFAALACSAALVLAAPPVGGGTARDTHGTATAATTSATPAAATTHSPSRVPPSRWHHVPSALPHGVPAPAPSKPSPTVPPAPQPPKHSATLTAAAEHANGLFSVNADIDATIDLRDSVYGKLQTMVSAIVDANAHKIVSELARELQSNATQHAVSNSLTTAVGNIVDAHAVRLIFIFAFAFALGLLTFSVALGGIAWAVAAARMKRLRANGDDAWDAADVPPLMSAGGKSAEQPHSAITPSAPPSASAGAGGDIGYHAMSTK